MAGDGGMASGSASAPPFASAEANNSTISSSPNPVNAKIEVEVAKLVIPWRACARSQPACSASLLSAMTCSAALRFTQVARSITRTAMATMDFAAMTRPCPRRYRIGIDQDWIVKPANSRMLAATCTICASNAFGYFARTESAHQRASVRWCRECKPSAFMQGDRETTEAKCRDASASALDRLGQQGANLSFISQWRRHRELRTAKAAIPGRLARWSSPPIRRQDLLGLHQLPHRHLVVHAWPSSPKIAFLHGPGGLVGAPGLAGNAITDTKPSSLSAPRAPSAIRAAPPHIGGTSRRVARTPALAGSQVSAMRWMLSATSTLRPSPSVRC